MVRQCQLVNNKEEVAESHNRQGTWQRKQTIDLTADTLLQHSAMVSYIKVCVFALCPSSCRIKVSATSSCIHRCWTIKKKRFRDWDEKNPIKTMAMLLLLPHRRKNMHLRCLVETLL